MLLFILIITIPAFLSLLNNNYFTMHDDQHIVRLFLLDKGIGQGYLYPRWVDGLGFNFGYPLYNFYPPLPYYAGWIFHLLGFSLIWSIKLTFILGFILAAFGIYLFVKKFLGKLPAVLASVLYTYFFYHAVLVYVRGALAEFFAMAVIPYVFLTIVNIAEKPNIRNSIFFGISFAALILTHPLVAVPSVFFIGFFFLFYLWRLSKERIRFVKYFSVGILTGLLLSLFFWLPSISERKFTMVDPILTRELASYKLHYIYPTQFLYSPWGYGGSIPGPFDGMTFQLGKVHIGLVLLAAVFSIVFAYRHSGKRPKGAYPESGLLKADSGQARMTLMQSGIGPFSFFLFLLLFSLFMSTPYSSFIWDNVRYLWYLQFPWRFLLFVGFFISIVGAYAVYFLRVILSEAKDLDKKRSAGFFGLRPQNDIVMILIILILISPILVYQKYFRPQQFLKTDDKARTSFDEVSWRISATSFEFAPRGVKTKKSVYDTTVFDIEKDQLRRSPYEIVFGETDVFQKVNKFGKKSFEVFAKTKTKFRLNTFHFPGWSAYLDGKEITIDDLNDYKLITVDVPPGRHLLEFLFGDTQVRKVANFLSVIAVIIVGALLFIVEKKGERVGLVPKLK